MAPHARAVHSPVIPRTVRPSRAGAVAAVRLGLQLSRRGRRQLPRADAGDAGAAQAVPDVIRAARAEGDAVDADVWPGDGAERGRVRSAARTPHTAAGSGRRPSESRADTSRRGPDHLPARLLLRVLARPLPRPPD